MKKSHSGTSSAGKDSGSVSTVQAQGPPKSRPLVPKKPHRRGPHACDECRLRKRACDAGNPCRLCRRFETECTYDFRRHTPRPTTRIRALQDRLRQAHGWMQHVRTTLPQGVPGLDLDECIRTLDFNVPDKDEVTSSLSQPASSASSPALQSHEVSLQASSDGQGLFIPEGIRAGTPRSYYGPLSDVSFIIRTIETLQTIPSPSASGDMTGNAATVSALVDRPPLNSSNPNPPNTNAASDLPVHAAELVRIVLERHDLMLSFIAETEVATWAQGPCSDPVSEGGIALLHAVLALAYLYDGSAHSEWQCAEAIRTATQHFQASVRLSASSDACDESSLATTVCGAVFLLALSYHAQAYSLIGQASSTALRLGLLVDGERPDDPSHEPYKLRSRLLATVMCLDMVGAIILDAPPFWRSDLMPFSKVLSLAQRAEKHEDLPAAALLRQTVVLAIPLSIRFQPGQQGDRQSQLFKQAVHDFQAWARDSAPLLTKLAEDQKSLSIKKELEISYHLGHVILFRPHLYYIRDMYAGKRISIAESYYALACIKAASSIIPLAESIAPAPESWLTLHAVFSAVTCLVYLVAAHPATTLPSVAWQRARRGVRIIAASKCVHNAASTSIQVLKVITHTLRQTVYIDFDSIEATTRNRCNNLANEGNTYAAGPRNLLFGDDSFTTGNLTRNDLTQNEADRMLEQAEALEGDMDFEDWLDFHEHSD